MYTLGMREIRTTVADLQPGEMVLAIGGKDVNERFREFKTFEAGHAVAGPRGGQYRLTAHGAAQRIGVVLYSGRTPICGPTTSARVLRDVE